VRKLMEAAMQASSITGKLLYLSPGAKKLQEFLISEAPAIQPNLVRVVCISDTHNEHDSLTLPWGHVLIHSGDVLTASGSRYIEQSGNATKSIKPGGRELFERFAVWFGSLPHPHKILVGGNHDWVMQAMGYDAIVQVLSTYCQPGTFVYLEHAEATVGPLKVFGSPYAHWGGSNDAFMNRDADYKCVSPDTHIFITHMPAIIPHDTPGKFHEDPKVVPAMVRSGSLLHVGGHCHWAQGVYFTEKRQIPSLCAPQCGPDWLKPNLLKIGPSGKRGDPQDYKDGGYNLHFLPMVADLLIPGGCPGDDEKWVLKGAK